MRRQRSFISPGPMTLLFAEQGFEIEDINGEFGLADVAIILGANSFECGSIPVISTRYLPSEEPL